MTQSEFNEMFISQAKLCSLLNTTNSLISYYIKKGDIKCQLKLGDSHRSGCFFAKEDLMNPVYVPNLELRMNFKGLFNHD